ncbi:hypothetical protein M569_05919 [Genlisea aurea]|uniref:Uncharacterized protein n=1 Tax=Genlisea aurea TaxID=192259 RepID=S8CQ74_9LAMI|nr:hypothetical protein M569_05919 [Genlisea aurea]
MPLALQTEMMEEAADPRDVDMEDELTGELLQNHDDAYSGYDIVIEPTKEGEAIAEYLSLVAAAEASSSSSSSSHHLPYNNR